MKQQDKKTIFCDVGPRLPVFFEKFFWQWLLTLWCLGPELNRRDMDFQSIALPAELPRHILDAKEKIVGFEPTTDCLTDNCSTKWAKYFLKEKIAVCV